MMHIGWRMGIAVGFVLVGASARAEVSVPALIGDNMVLQARQPVRLWGSADVDEAIIVSFAGKQAATRADGQGHWSVELGPFTPSDKGQLVIAGRNSLRFENVVVGEVWIASGQSNMEFPLSRAANAASEIASADQPAIRLFTVAKATAHDPRSDVAGRWEVCDSTTAAGFSAVAYFFGRTLAKELGTNVGLIHSSWGGTPAEAWTSRGALIADPELRALVETFDARRADPAARAEYERAMDAWERKNVAVDPGNRGVGRGFARSDFDDSSWRTMEVPGFWEASGLLIDGAVWFRREVAIPASLAGQDLTLSLGPIDDYDTAYFDGVEVGRTGRETPGFWTVPRAYRVPGRLVRAGRIVVAVRVFDRAGDGGFGGASRDLALHPGPAAGFAIPLAGPWRYEVEHAVSPVTPDWGTQPAAPEDQNSPTVLFNAMLAPLTRISIQGAIWYQGESNADRAGQYRRLFPAMIRDWRRAFDLGTFPFLFVQLANFMDRAPQPGESAWAELREAQAMTLRRERNTAMAVAIDIGEAGDIHPRDKATVGRRLALAALARSYGRDIEFSGPRYASYRIEGAQIRVSFDHASGLHSTGAEATGFAIAGKDGRFVWASVRIEGTTVVVSSPEVPGPRQVRYAWGDNPQCNLYNSAGLPAVPFRTDAPRE